VAAAGPTADDSKTTRKTTRVNTKVEITDLEANAIVGELDAKKDTCLNGRLVTAFYRTADDPTVIQGGTVESTRKGKFRIPQTIEATNIYIVGAGKKTITKTRTRDGDTTIKKTVCKEGVSDVVVAE
jgi:hypothetical protein